VVLLMAPSREALSPQSCQQTGGDVEANGLVLEYSQASRLSVSARFDE
jgi:hypothetical protein